MLQILAAADARDDAPEFGRWTGYRVPEDRSAWHPLVRALYDYWTAMTPPGRLPGRQHVIPEDIAPLWSRLWMLDVSRPPLRYRYRFCGTEVARSLGRDVTGWWLDKAHPEIAAIADSRERFRFMAETGCPTWRRGPPLWDRNADHHAVESCIVPLAADGRIVDKMLALTVVFDSTGRSI